MTNTTITKGDWTFKLIRKHQWQVLHCNTHFAYVSHEAVNRALASF